MTLAAEPMTLVRAPEERNSWPGLERIAASLAERMAAQLDGFSAATRPGEVKTLEAFGAELGETHVSVRYRMAPLKGAVLLSLPVELVQSLVDWQFGGAGETSVGRHHLHTSECRYFERLAGQVAEAIAKSWQDFVRVEPTIAHIDKACAVPVLGAPAQKVVIQTITLKSRSCKDWLCHLVTPLSLISTVPQLAETAVEEEDAQPVDPAWHAAFSKAVMQVRLPVRTIFARPELPLNQLMTLKAGDIIPLCLSDKLPVTVGGVRFAEASVGESNGRAAIRIETSQNESIHDE